MDNDPAPRRRASRSVSPRAWAVALVGPVVVAALLLPFSDQIRTSN